MAKLLKSKKQIQDIINRNNYIFSKFGIKKLALFGSYVRDEQKENSDVDFIVEFEKSSFRNYIDLARELEKLLNLKVDLLTLAALSKYLKHYVLKEAEYFEG